MPGFAPKPSRRNPAERRAGMPQGPRSCRQKKMCKSRPIACTQNQSIESGLRFRTFARKQHIARMNQMLKLRLAELKKKTQQKFNGTLR
ncbi:MAG: hypothetical protein D6767_01820 [Candidatus Hydrogenedentota bacterium]|nr:MAG: hypothetical protein D6767_01820 [Candidatus Hydrogenedentota bacterium]